MARQTRRDFLKTSLAASAAFSTFTIAGTKSSGNVLGANDAVRVGVIGCGGRGGAHIGTWSGMSGVDLTYLIDPDQTRANDKRAEQLKSRSGVQAKAIADVRRALEDPNLDAVSVATPNHWHSLMTIWACQAGKDVYVEKPLSHNIHEGRVAVDAAKKHGRIVQHGTQSRSSGRLSDRLKAIESGELGKLRVSRGLCYKKRLSIGVQPHEAAPETLAFDLWLGPAPKQSYHKNLVPYNWHWFWDFGNGDIGNQGVHQMDIARWMIPGATWPKSVMCVGGRFGYSDQGETPNTQLAVFDYGESLLIFEVRGLVDKNDTSNSQTFEEGGSTAKLNTPTDAEIAEVAKSVKGATDERGPGRDTFSNFIECVRSRKQADLDAHVLEGHYSSGLCHLANISYRLGQEAPFNKQTKAFGDDKEAYATFERMQDHLKDRGVKLEETAYHVGRRLEFDPVKEQFVGDAEANALLTRTARSPFAVPEKIA
ncbi:MAG: Gfo/Idh/MocA family oxidoreductase [Planctomycetaceae bacterium]